MTCKGQAGVVVCVEVGGGLFFWAWLPPEPAMHTMRRWMGSVRDGCVGGWVCWRGWVMGGARTYASSPSPGSSGNWEAVMAATVSRPSPALLSTRSTDSASPAMFAGVSVWDHSSGWVASSSPFHDINVDFNVVDIDSGRTSVFASHDLDPTLARSTAVSAPACRERRAAHCRNSIVQKVGGPFIG